MKRIILWGLLIISISAAGSNVEHLNSRFREFYLTGNMKAWKQTVDSLRLVELDNAKELVLLYAEYGLIGHYIGSKQQELARVELPIFEMRIENALKRLPGDANLYAFSAAMVAYKIALQPWKAPFYIFSHSEYLRKAAELSVNLGLPLVEQGNALYFKPSLVGGDRAESVKYYERAFEFYKENCRNHWMYYNVGAWLAQVYANQNQKEKAEVLYLQLLKEAPEFKWVKEDLLPALKAGKKAYGYFE